MGTRRREVTAEELAAPLLAYGDAVERIADAFDPLESRPVPLDEAAGLVLAEDVVAADDVPAFDNSAMDGFAVRSADLVDAPVGELVVGDLVGPGMATTVMTGQPIPDGADAVVPWEQVERLESGRIRVLEPVPAGRSIRPRAGDVAAGSTVLRAGARVGPAEVGLLAAVGCDPVAVHPRPRVGLLSGGDELVDVADPVGPGRVRDVNTPLLGAVVRGEGAAVVGVERVPDDLDAVVAGLRRLAGASDLVVTSGGASVGEHDFLRVALEQAGELAFWRIAMRPGKPVALGRIDGTPVIVLPGNPGSVLACAHVVVARALRRLAGREAAPPTVPAVLADAIEGDPQRTVVHPVRLRDGVAVPAAARSSQVLSNAIGHDGWVIVPPGGVEGDLPVQVELTPWR